MPVRHATEEDIPRCVAMGKCLHERAGSSALLPFDPDSFAATLRGMIASPAAAVLVHEHGFAGCLTFPSYFNASTTMAQKLFWWVEPGHLRAHRELFEAMETWARSKDAAVFLASVNAAMPGALRLYRRMGFEPADVGMMKRITP